MANGTVKWFNADKGFGFITRPGESDIFVHVTNVSRGPLVDGSPVEFEVSEGRKGPEATNVSLVG